MSGKRFLRVFGGLFLFGLFVHTQGHAAETLITSAVTPDGSGVPYILNRNDAQPRYVLILFPGGNGIVNPRLEEGELRYEKKGNFLLRAREYWVDDDFATAVTNSTQAPERVEALLRDLRGRFPESRIYLVGTSRGTHDTMALAAYLSERIDGEIHTSSLWQIADFDPRKYKNRHLIVHHRKDTCRVTPFHAAESSHERFGSDLIVMEGGVSAGNPCEAFGHHGFNGIERQTVEAIKDWVRKAPE